MANSIRLVSEEFAPLQFSKQGVNAGYVHQYLQEAIRRVNLKYPITISSYEFLPWKRAMKAAVSAPNVLFFSISRTPKREQQYHWLGEVSVYHQSFHRLKNNPIQARNISQLKAASHSISVQHGGAVFDYLTSQDFKFGTDFHYYINHRQGIRQLFNNRVDLIPLNDATARQAACREGFDGNQLVAQIPIKPLANPLWAVFSKGTSNELVTLFREAMRDIKREGLFEQYYTQSMLYWANLPC